jgi:hypothetical protein
VALGKVEKANTKNFEGVLNAIDYKVRTLVEISVPFRSIRVFHEGILSTPINEGKIKLHKVILIPH